MNEWIILTTVVISGQLALGMSLFAAAARGDRGMPQEPQPTDVRITRPAPAATAATRLGGLA
jgi:hypothetical protein